MFKFDVIVHLIITSITKLSEDELNMRIDLIEMIQNSEWEFHLNKFSQNIIFECEHWLFTEYVDYIFIQFISINNVRIDVVSKKNSLVDIVVNSISVDWTDSSRFKSCHVEDDVNDARNRMMRITKW